MKKILKFFTPGWILFYLCLTLFVSVHYIDYDETTVSTGTYDSGTYSITARTFGDYTENVYTMLMTSTFNNEYVVKIECDNDSTIIVGYSRHRAPDGTSATYMCKAEDSITFKAYGGWFTIASNGVAEKIGLYSYAPYPTTR